MAAPKFFKDLVLYNINGRNINIPTLVGVKTGNYKYILKLNELSQVGFSTRDYITLEKAINEKAKEVKLGFILFLLMEGHGNKITLEITLRSGIKLTDENVVTAPQTNQGALMSEIETIVQEIQRNKLNPQPSQTHQKKIKKTAPRWNVGDIVFYAYQSGDKDVVKIDGYDSSSHSYIFLKKEFDSSTKKVNTIEQQTEINFFDINSSIILFNKGDKYKINRGNGFEEVTIETKLDGNFQLVDKNGVIIYIGTYEETVKFLYNIGAVVFASSKTAPVQSATFSREPDDYVFSKKSGYIYGVYVDKTSSRNYDLLAYDNGVEIKNQIDEFALSKNYKILILNDGLKFSIPAGILPPYPVVYTFTNSGEYFLLYEDGKPYRSFLSINDLKFYLLSIEAKVILDGFEEADNLKDSTEKSIPAAFEEDEIETLNKDISQLMFFKSILSPIDFEKKIEISQEIEKKQKRVNDLNFYMLEKRFKSDNIFEDLFEQSFTPINNVYTGVYTPNPEDTDFFTPNGKKSELSDALNVMIRTPQFKAWFGDWELAYLYKDTDAIEIECSKVLTENFEPLVVWHGTGQEFSYFKFDSFPAAYFAVRREYSQFFADLHGGGDGFVIPFFLNIRNPLDLTHFRTNDVSVKDFFDYLFLQTGLDMDDLGVNPIFMDSSLKPMQTWIFIRNNPNMLKRIAELKIFDGIHFYETNPNIKDKSSPAYETEAYITFSANQSKIADPNRGMILLASMKSFILEKGGAI